MGGFHKWGYPQIIHFSGIFPLKPSILGYNHFQETPNGVLASRCRCYGVPLFTETLRQHEAQTQKTRHCDLNAGGAFLQLNVTGKKGD